MLDWNKQNTQYFTGYKHLLKVYEAIYFLKITE